jgi:hypothetical protein
VLNEKTSELNLQYLNAPKLKIFENVCICRNNSSLEILKNKIIILEINKKENFEIKCRKKKIPLEICNYNDKYNNFDIIAIKKETILSPILCNNFEIRVNKKLPELEIIQSQLINLISPKTPFDYNIYIEEKIKSLETLRCENINITEKRKIPENQIFCNPNLEILNKKIQSIYDPLNLDSFELYSYDSNSTMCLLKKFDKKIIKSEEGIKTLLSRPDIEITKNIEIDLICKKSKNETSTSITPSELLKMNNIYLKPEYTNNNLQYVGSYPKVTHPEVIKEYLNKKLQSLELSLSNKNNINIKGNKKPNKFEVIKEDLNKLSFSILVDAKSYINNKSTHHKQSRAENISFGVDKKSYQMNKSKINNLNLVESIFFDVDRNSIIKNKNRKNLFNREENIQYQVDKKTYQINKSKNNISSKAENILFDVDRISYVKNKSLKYNISTKESNFGYEVDKTSYQIKKSHYNVTIFKGENIYFEVDKTSYIKNKSKCHTKNLAESILFNVDLTSYLKTKSNKNIPMFAENLYIEKKPRTAYVSTSEVSLDYNKYKSNILKNISKKLEEKFQKNSLYKFILWKEKVRNANVKNNLKRTIGMKKTIGLILRSNQRFVINNIFTSLEKIYTEKLIKEKLTSILKKLSYTEKILLIANFNKWKIISNKIISNQIYNEKDKKLEEMLNLKNKFEELSEQKEKDIIKTKKDFERKLVLIRIYKSHEKHLQKINHSLKHNYLSLWKIHASEDKYSKIIEKSERLISPKTFKLHQKIICYRKNFVAMSHKTQYLLHIKRRHGVKDHFKKWLSTISKLREIEKNTLVRVKSIKMNIVKKSMNKLIESSGSGSSEDDEIESPFNSSLMNRSSMSQDKLKFRSISKTIQKKNLSMLDFSQRRTLKNYFLKWKSLNLVVPGPDINKKINKNPEINSNYSTKNQSEATNSLNNHAQSQSQSTFKNLQVMSTEFVEFSPVLGPCQEFNNNQLNLPEPISECDSVSQAITLDNYTSNRPALNPLNQQPYRLRSRPNTVVNTQNHSEVNISIDHNVTHANFTLNTHKTNDSFTEADESFEDVAIGGAIEIQTAWRNYKLRQYFAKYATWLKILHALLYNLKEKNTLKLKKSFIKWRRDVVSNRVDRASQAITSSLNEKIKSLRTKRKSLSYETLNNLLNTYLHFKIIQEGFKNFKKEFRLWKGTTKLNNCFKIIFLKKLKNKKNLKVKSCNTWDQFSASNFNYNEEVPHKMNFEELEKEISKKAIQQYKNFLSKMQHYFSKYENVNMTESTREALRSWLRKMKLLRRKDHSMLKMVKIINNHVRKETIDTMQNKLNTI